MVVVVLLLVRRGVLLLRTKVHGVVVAVAGVVVVHLVLELWGAL